VVGSAFVTGDAVSATVSDPAGYCEPASAQYDPGDLGSPLLDPLPAGVHERLTVLKGIRTPLLESGPRGGQTAVVFVHGNPGSSRDFADLVGRSGALGLRTLAFDLPGFGLAGRPWSFPYTAAGELDWFTAALRQLGVHRAILVVHDIGGPLAMQWAAEHGSALVAAVIIDSGVLVGYQDHYLARIWKTPVGGEQFHSDSSIGCMPSTTARRVARSSRSTAPCPTWTRTRAPRPPRWRRWTARRWSYGVSTTPISRPTWPTLSATHFPTRTFMCWATPRTGPSWTTPNR
jgi:pimeloyl-ACP methyl ester carboxylesterase